MRRGGGLCTTSTYASSTGRPYALGREFNINVAGRLPPEQKPKRFTYTDTNGRQTPIYLRLDQVAAIVVTPAGASANQA